MCLKDTNGEMLSKIENDKNFLVALSRSHFDNFPGLSMKIVQSIYYHLISSNNTHNTLNTNTTNNTIKTTNTTPYNTVYNTIKTSSEGDQTNSELNCLKALARRGNHWEKIGFQGEDPGTDLRGGGVLSLLQLLHFIQSCPTLAHLIFEYSNHDHGHFPFSALSIHFTVICVSVLKRGKLDAVVDTKMSLFEAFNVLYNALFFKFYKFYCKKLKNIRELSYVMEKIEKRTHKQVRKLIRRYSRNGLLK